MMQDDQIAGYPRIDPLGLDGVLVRFAGEFSESGNRAALAFRAAFAQAGVPGVEEVASSLVGVRIRFDPMRITPAELSTALAALLDSRDWCAAPLGARRRLWRVPTVYGGAFGPQLGQAAALARQNESQAVHALSTARLRVMAIGFAPGQPYLGQLPAAWSLPRQTDLQTRVPPGTLALAVRQMVLFPAETQTGWYHVARTAFACFRPGQDPAFPLEPGDEMEFPSVPHAEFPSLQADASGNGGATCEVLE
jgi:KipI family sensor histidine kinase inhibitor